MRVYFLQRFNGTYFFHPVFINDRFVARCSSSRRLRFLLIFSKLMGNLDGRIAPALRKKIMRSFSLLLGIPSFFSVFLYFLPDVSQRPNDQQGGTRSLGSILSPTHWAWRPFAAFSGRVLVLVFLYIKAKLSIGWECIRSSPKKQSIYKKETITPHLSLCSHRKLQDFSIDAFPLWVTNNTF